MFSVAQTLSNMRTCSLLAFLLLSSCTLVHCMTRKERFFSIFNIVSFENSVCTSDDNLMGGMTRRGRIVLTIAVSGVCYTSSQCREMNGQPRGSCASGFGTCCVFISDGMNELKVVERKVGYIQNPNYPRDNSSTFRDTVEIRPISEKIRQIRLDMIDFEVTLARL